MESASFRVETCTSASSAGSLFPSNLTQGSVAFPGLPRTSAAVHIGVVDIQREGSEATVSGSSGVD